MTPHEKDMFLGMFELLRTCKATLRASRDLAYKHKDTVYVPFINDALENIDSRLERVNEYLHEMKQKKGR